MELLVIIAIVIGVKIYHAYEDAKFSAYDKSNISAAKMACDFKSSPRQVMRNAMRGKYDKDPNRK